MIEIMPFGRTGHDSTRVIFGAAALGGMSQGRADATLELVSQAGINHIDTARSYGESELRLAPWLADHRHEVFLASKTGERTADGARRQLEESLQRLGVDHIDLIQLHNLVEDDEFEVAHGPGGVVEAMVAARDEGLVRFIGVTGHGLRIAGMHLRSLERFDFDSVLFPYNFALMGEPGYRSDVAELRTVCTELTVLDFGMTLAQGTQDEVLRDPAVIAAYHLGYGIGGWRGLWDMLRGRASGAAFTRLTR